MTHILRIFSLITKLHTLTPQTPLDRVIPAVIAAVSQEIPERGITAELLLVIAQHESDLEPRAVSFRAQATGHRVDLRSWANQSIPNQAACGLTQTIAYSPDRCKWLMSPDHAMQAVVIELLEELQACYNYDRQARSGQSPGAKPGLMPCALSYMSGGLAGLKAWRSNQTTDATRFALYFFARARYLVKLSLGPVRRPI